MRPTTAIPLSFFLISLVAPTLAHPQASAVSSLAGQALAPARVPDPEIVPSTFGFASLRPTTEGALEVDLFAPPADAPDDPAMAEEIDKESAELEEMRQAEEESHVADDAVATSGEGRIDPTSTQLSTQVHNTLDAPDRTVRQCGWRCLQSLVFCVAV
jgi:membrane-bound lytic murein transglycosylase D